MKRKRTSLLPTQMRRKQGLTWTKKINLLWKRKMSTDHIPWQLLVTVFKSVKSFFLATLGISEAFSNDAMQNHKDGVFVGEDRRGKHELHNKTTKNAMEIVRKHIEYFPVVDGHFTRKDFSRKYLGADLNITRMYQLYLEEVNVKYQEARFPPLHPER